MAIKSKRSVDTGDNETQMKDSLLASNVSEFLCRIGGSYGPITDEASDLGATDGIVGLTCPINKIQQAANEVDGEEQETVKFFCRVPYLEVLSSGNPEIAAAEKLNRLICTHKVFVLWTPEELLNSDYTTFQIAQVRHLVLGGIPSHHNMVQSLCRTPAEIQMLRQVLIFDSTDPVMESLIGSQIAEDLCDGLAELSSPRTLLERLQLLTTLYAGCCHITMELIDGSLSCCYLFPQSFKSLDNLQIQHPYLKNLPVTLSNALKDSMQYFNKGGYNVVGLIIDDSESSVVAGAMAKIQSPDNLTASFDAQEPRYYLVSWNGRYYLIFYIPDKRDLAARFLYSLFKTTISLQLEKLLGIRMAKSVRIAGCGESKCVVDLREGEPAAPIFEPAPKSSHYGEHQILLVSDVTARPRPQITRRCVDPFVLIKSIIKPDGQVEYVSVDATTRFKF